MKSQKVKFTTVALAVIVFVVSTSAFKCSVSGTGNATVTCPAGQRCTTTVSGGITITKNLAGGAETNINSISNRLYILDLAKQWQVNNIQTLQATFSVAGNNGQSSQQTFQMSAVSASDNGISRVDKQTIPNVFVFNNPSDVQNFLNNTNFSGTSEPATVSFTADVTPLNCDVSSGDYLTHLRYKDEDGITFVDSQSIRYTKADNFWAGDGSCDGSYNYGN